MKAKFRSREEFLVLAHSLKAIYDNTAREAGIRNRMIIYYNTNTVAIQHDAGEHGTARSFKRRKKRRTRASGCSRHFHKKRRTGEAGSGAAASNAGKDSASDTALAWHATTCPQEPSCPWRRLLQDHGVPRRCLLAQHGRTGAQARARPSQQVLFAASQMTGLADRPAVIGRLISRRCHTHRSQVVTLAARHRRLQDRSLPRHRLLAQHGRTGAQACARRSQQILLTGSQATGLANSPAATGRMILTAVRER